MEDFNSESDSDYASYWRDWVGAYFLCRNNSVFAGAQACGVLVSPTIRLPDTGLPLENDLVGRYDVA
jgi:hypothetical protein